MATGTLILRPSADISVEHEKEPSNSANAYSLISEEVADDDSTYLKGAVSIASGKRESLSSFRMSLSSPAKIDRVTKVTVTERISGSKYFEDGQVYGEYFTLSINGTALQEYQIAKSLPTGYANYTLSVPAAVTPINNYIEDNISLPEITISLRTYYGGGSKSFYSNITQVYITIEYEYSEDIGVYHKVGGAWKPATAAYKKVNGTWTEITGDECKAYLKEQFGVT